MMRRRHKAAALCLAFLFVFPAFASCNSNDPGRSAGTGQDSRDAGSGQESRDAGSAQEGRQAGSAQQTKTVAVLLPGPDEYFNATKAGMDRAAAEFGFEISYADADWDAERQMSQIEDFIEKKADILAICCVDADAVETAIPMALGANIPVIAFKNAIGRAPTGQYPGLVTFVGQNEEDTGETVGEHAKALLGAGGGKVIVIEGDDSSTQQARRRAGFMKAIEAQPNIEVVYTASSEGDKENATSIIKYQIDYNTEFDLVYAQDAGSGVGAAAAIVEAGRRDSIYVLAIDGSVEAMQSVKDGLIDSTTWMSAKEEGYMAIEAANRYFNGESVPSVTQLAQILITKDNCDEYEAEY